MNYKYFIIMPALIGRVGCHSRGTLQDTIAEDTRMRGTSTCAFGIDTPNKHTLPAGPKILVHKIQTEISKQEALSLQIKKMKVFGKIGQLILQGRTQNEDEKQRVEKLAERFAMDTTVFNDLYF